MSREEDYSADAMSSEIRNETMCVCFPLRLGVMLVAFFSLLSSVLYACDRSYWEYEFRHFSGGYALASRVVVGATELSGIPFGVLGVLGVWYSKRSYVVWFNMWQVVRLISWLPMYYVDVPMLENCDLWVNNVQLMVKDHGWNDLMYEIAMKAECPSERQKFYVFSFLAFLFFMYVTYCCFKFQDFMGRAPKHLLRVPKDLSTGAFYAHSTGERSYMQGTYGSEAKHSGGVSMMPGSMVQGGGMVPGLSPAMGMYGPVGMPVGVHH
mmetsp:Transcript_40161/g.87749  ORF Transcript_40161/g.87749 Transcript_40161/m.87749 type:complete len:266 (-) Transcript_40161:83-880(-)|eukprot:CAMPEP_0170629652 /NCGR_PEP_ID=MMETSP0224-20130122/33483_1 /TAXON_ID=285029 /ORGANISM="Togula jolla, Strain CCCM 725" /LENGTH=265 /DNA_ID=CAMNT_0010957461 /DNA_START=135 /DNA_END=932 /DNA_ORIENTATION=+